jgi:hypothetical protein
MIIHANKTLIDAIQSGAASIRSIIQETLDEIEKKSR